MGTENISTDRTLSASDDCAGGYFLVLDNLRIHYRVDGSITGEPILLIHGLFSSLNTWDEWVAVLSKTYRVIRFDLPGFGLSQLPENVTVYSLESKLLVTIVDHLLDHIGLKAVHIAGNSLGGYVSWSYAIHKPERVKTLNLIAPIAYSQQLPFPLSLISAPLISKIVPYIRPTLTARIGLQCVYGDPSRINYARTKNSVDPDMSLDKRKNIVQVAVQLRKESKNISFSNKLKNIKQPTLIAWGEKDSLTPVTLAKRLISDIPDSKLIVYPNVGHIPMEEIPETTMSDYKDFLLKVAVRQSA